MTDFFQDAEALDKNALETGTVLAPRFDANGLVTAITVEAGTNEVLMLAHMNEQALRLTLETGLAHYYSRSRKSLWKKGESSGEMQKLVELRVDCDQDAVLVIVELTGRGAACHTGRKSCFFRAAVPRGDHFGLKTVGKPPLFDPKKVYDQ